MIHSHIFRAYDIRGVFEKDFDSLGAEEIGKAYGTYLIRTSHNIQKPLVVCVGRDGRTHSQEIQDAFMRGLLFVGIKVVDIGLAFSPLLFYSICKGRFDGGVNITASHNPKEYNGFKLQRDFAHAICGDEIQEILQILETQDFIIAEERECIEKRNYWKEYKHTLKELHPHRYREKVVIDAGSGVTGAFAPEVFTELGYDVVPLYCEVDGNFPYHQPDPEDPINLQDLQKKVLEENASMGIAFDGDGDRVGIVDAEGTIYTADFILLLLLQDVLKRNKGSAVVYTVTSSMLIKNEIIRLGGNPVESRVGHSFVEEKMRETQALLGGESSGHMFMAENYYGYDDAFLAALQCLAIVFSSEKPLKEHFQHLPKTYVSPEIKFVVDDNEKFIVIEKLVKYFKQSSYKYNDIDGIKVYFDNDSWGICRASNTSPKISIICESKDQKYLQKITTIMQEAIEPFLV